MTAGRSDPVSLKIRGASQEDLPAVLRLYARPEMDSGNVLPLAKAREIFGRMQSYPAF